MPWNALGLIAGAAIALMTLRDVFETVVVPGGSKATLRIARRLVLVLLPLWKRVRGRRGISPTFAPLVLVGAFVIWMALLAVGFGLMAFALKDEFVPPLASFFDGLYVAGCSLITIGLSETDATGTARWVIVAAGFCGLAVMTMAITYLLMVQTSVAKRDIGIIRLNTSAGDPPSGVAFLENYASSGNRDELGQVLREARDWCATVRQSHASHPLLIYFRSVSTGSGWPAALGAMLDMALFCHALIVDEALRGPAVLMRADGLRMAEELARLARLEPVPGETTEDEIKDAAQRLARCGYALRSGIDFTQVALERGRNRAWVKAMAAHLGKPAAPLLPGPIGED
jgi:hypothetical protein